MTIELEVNTTASVQLVVEEQDLATSISWGERKKVWEGGIC
jgi:hypothetical protein